MMILRVIRAVPNRTGGGRQDVMAGALSSAGPSKRLDYMSLRGCCVSTCTDCSHDAAMYTPSVLIGWLDN